MWHLETQAGARRRQNGTRFVIGGVIYRGVREAKTKNELNKRKHRKQREG